MGTQEEFPSTVEYEKDMQADKLARGKEKYTLRLYVSGMTSKSIRAIENIKKICKECLEGRYDLEIIDIRKDPKIAKTENIIASPTLIKKLPPPLRGIIGDMLNEKQVLVALDLIPNEEKKR
jgi:circadian clock protein KaiB